MPFEGPEGQGPYDSIEECVADIEDNEDIDDPEALCGYWKELDENQDQANAMTDTDEPEYRTYHQASAGEVYLREVDDESDEGMMSVRMPIASTGDVRNEGDDPLTRDELDGMARQINDGDVGVFLAHGDSFEITDARYGQTERLGTWRDADISGSDERDDGDGSDLLMASAEMPDPETLSSATGRYREALAIIKEQAKRNVPLSASIGWREDEDSPGGNDLMEASIVGIPADPRTVTQDGPAVAVARAAVDAGAEPEALVEAVRVAVTGDGDGSDPTADTDPDTDHDMTEDDSTEPDAENEAEGADDEAQDEERQEAPEWAADLRELLETMNETLGDVAEAVRQEDDDDEDDDDDEEENETDEDDEDDENAADTQAADADVTADQREALDTLREGGYNVDDLDLPEPDPDAEHDADADDDDSESESATRDTDHDEEHPLDKYAFPQ